MMRFGVIARIKAPKGYKGVWINIYKLRCGRFHAGGAYKTRKEADDVCKPYRYDCVFTFVKVGII